MIGSISATAVYVESLPTPPQLKVARPPPSLHQHGGGGGGDSRGRVLALATRVERIGAVNRQVGGKACLLFLVALLCKREVAAKFHGAILFCLFGFSSCLFVSSWHTMGAVR